MKLIEKITAVSIAVIAIEVIILTATIIWLLFTK